MFVSVKTLQWINFLVYHHAPARSLEILLVYIPDTGLLHTKHVDGAFSFLDWWTQQVFPHAYS